MNIDKIMDMLDWNNDLSIQEEGLRAAEEISCLSVFLLPNEQYNKNVGDNCALILSKKTDEKLRPYISYLLGWLYDRNWPGRDVIFQRLNNFKDYGELASAISWCTKAANANGDIMWIEGMSDFLRNPKLCCYLSEEVKCIMETALIKWNQDEI